MKIHARKKNVYCKHICFVYKKVCKLDRAAFYNSKWLTADELQHIYTRMSQLSSGTCDNTIQNAELINKYNALTSGQKNDNIEITASPFSVNIMNRTLDDECPICFDSYVDSNVLFCQTCGNVVHKKCIEKWLETRNDCIYCRSTIWLNYKKSISNVSSKSKAVKSSIIGTKYITL
jgi:hypothetical protein